VSWGTLAEHFKRSVAFMEGASGAQVLPAAAGVAAPAPPQKTPTATWTPDLDQKFVSAWGEEFLRINQGNFKPHNWAFVAEQINRELPDGHPPFTIKQCQEKMNTLKRRFTAELKKKTSTGSVNTDWVLFDVLAPYLKKLAKVIGIPGAIDSGLEEVPAPVVLEKESGNNAETGGNEYILENAGSESDMVQQPPTVGEQPQQIPSPVVTQNSPSSASEATGGKRKISEPTEHEVDPGFNWFGGPASPSKTESKFEKKSGINGHVNSKNKRLKGSPGAALARSIDNFTKVYASMATKALEVEERIAKDKADTNLQMLDIKLKYQTELEKMRRGVQDS
jgi:hypothetical protein